MLMKVTNFAAGGLVLVAGIGLVSTSICQLAPVSSCLTASICQLLSSGYLVLHLLRIIVVG